MTHADNEQLTPALLLVKVAVHESRPEVIKHLLATEHITRCEAVDGDCDIIATVEPLPGAGLERFVSSKVKSAKDVTDCELCLVDTQAETRPNQENALATAESIVFVESTPDRFETIFQTLTLLSATVSCQIAKSPYSFVVRLRGSNFDFLDKVVRDKILPLSGVLRAKQHRLLNLTGF